MSGGNRRPDVSIRIKRKDDQTTEYVFSGWKNENQRGIALRLATGWSLVGPDGEAFTTGKEGNAYLDLFFNDSSPWRGAQRRESGSNKAPPRSQAPRGGAGRRPPEDDSPHPADAAADFMDDDIPFLRRDF